MKGGLVTGDYILLIFCWAVGLLLVFLYLIVPYGLFAVLFFFYFFYLFIIFLQCIRKKKDGTWEKPSLSEGKIVRLTIEEIIQVIDVFSNKTSWNTVHKYKEKSTRIAINWDKDNQGFWINVGPYSRIIKFPQSEFFRQLLKHLMLEKIEFATSGEVQEKPPTIILESFHLLQFYIQNLKKLY